MKVRLYLINLMYSTTVADIMSFIDILIRLLEIADRYS